MYIQLPRTGNVMLTVDSSDSCVACYLHVVVHVYVHISPRGGAEATQDPSRYALGQVHRSIAVRLLHQKYHYSVSLKGATLNVLIEM